MTKTEPGRGWKPDRWEAASALSLVVLALAVAASPALASGVRSLGFDLLEVIGRVLDRPTGLVVAGYAVAVLAALGIDLRPALPRSLLPTQLLVCGLALLGQGYVLALAALLRPGWLVAALGAAAGAALTIRPLPLPARPAPVLCLFVFLHVLVEGAAGHILTPWLHAVSAAAAGLSRHRALYLLGVAAPAVLAPAGLGVWALRRGLRPRLWPHLDPRVAVDRLALPSLAALAVVGLHYATTVWGCPPGDAAGLRLVSPSPGAFDLEVSADGRRLLASRREERELLLIDLDSGLARRTSTARSGDSAFDRTEPETLLALPDGGFLVLLASSDSEQGNGLARLDPEAGTLGPWLAARGVSDVVDDGAGGVWISTEFAGRMVQIDPGTGAARQRIDVGGAETNKILVDAASGSAWSVGLWRDAWLRRVDLGGGRQAGAALLGTHQWDVALSVPHRLLFVPRLVEGRVGVFDADSLEVRGALEDGFGVRPVEVSPDGLLVVTGNLYTGRVVGHSVVTGEEAFDRRIGGHLKALEIGPRGRVFAGSDCGVFEILP